MSNGDMYRDKQWLRHQYTNKSLTAPEIADKCNCSKRTVYRWLHRHNITTRSGGGDAIAERRAADQRLTDPAWLREKYVKQEKSSREIADKIGCTKGAVQNWVNKHGIETDQHRKEPVDRLRDGQWLREQYVENGKSGYEIAQELGCSTSALYYWVREHGIETQHNGKVSGEDHWFYSGGKIRYGSGWNETKKQNVRRRDQYTCQDPRCSVTQSEHINKYGKKLHVHHLRKARRVDDPEDRNAKENLITLCRDCHKRWEKVADAGLVPQVVTDD